MNKKNNKKVDFRYMSLFSGVAAAFHCVKRGGKHFRNGVFTWRAIIAQ